MSDISGVPIGERSGCHFGRQVSLDFGGTSNMSELFIVVALHAKAGKEDELRRDLTAVVAPTRKEEGSVRYELFVDQGDPRRFVFIEQWATSEAQHKHHTEGPHIQEFNSQGAKNVERVEFLYRLSRIA